MKKVRDLFSQALQSKGLQSASLMTVGNIGSTGISAIAMILFSRYLGPVQFGIFSTLFSLLLIISKVGDLGINIALQRYIAGNKAKTNQIKLTIQAASFLKLIVIILMIIIGIFFNSWITAHLLNLAQEYSFLVALVFIFSGTVIFYEHIGSILQGMSYFGLSVLANFIQSASKLILGLVMLFSHTISIISVTLLYLITPFLGGLIGLFKISLTSLLPHKHIQEVHLLTSVAKWTSIAIISATIADNLDIIIVQNFLNSYDTGLWSAAVRIATVASLIGWSLGIVLNIRVAAYKDKSHLDKYLKKAIILAITSFIGISLLVFVSSLAIRLTVGLEFLSAVPSLNLLLISTAILTATAPFIALFYLFDTPQYFAYSGILGSALLIGGDFLAVPHYGLIGAGYIRIISRLAVFIFTLYYARVSYLKRFHAN